MIKTKLKTTFPHHLLVDKSSSFAFPFPSRTLSFSNSILSFFEGFPLLLVFLQTVANPLFDFLNFGPISGQG